MTLLVVLTLGLLTIAAANAVSPRLRVPPALLLVAVGVLAGLSGLVPSLALDPEVELAVLLPALLYAAAASMPATVFRREFTTVKSLSLVLVVVTALVLGLLFWWLIPGLGFGWGVALGAALAPTDSVTPGIARAAGLRGRVLSLVQGEMLLSGASALFLVRTVMFSAAVSFEFWLTVGQFFRAVFLAVLAGVLAGRLMLWLRSLVFKPAVSTVFSFATPFLASIPAELLGASGLVAAVTAGLATGRGALNWLNAQQRISDEHTWHAVEIVLEGAIFLLLGLQLPHIIAEVQHENASLGLAMLVSVVGFVTLLLVRINFMQPVLRGMDRRLHRDVQRRVRVETRRQSLPGDKVHPRWESRLRRWFADIAYQSAEPLGRNSGFLIAWAGVRGALSLAAVHTLPETMPHRGMATLVAFTIVLLSLLVQGLTLPSAARRLAAPRDLEAQQQQAQRLVAYLEEAASEPAAAHPGQATARTDPRYAALARARDEGGFDIEVLDAALRRLDAGELAEGLGTDLRPALSPDSNLHSEAC